MTFVSNRTSSSEYVQAVAPDGDRTTTTTSAAIDLSDSTWALVHVDYGVVTDGTFTPSVVDCATSGGTFVANTRRVDAETAAPKDGRTNL